MIKKLKEFKIKEFGLVIKPERLHLRNTKKSSYSFSMYKNGKRKRTWSFIANNLEDAKKELIKDYRKYYNI